jgi:hypothetical protein
LQINISSNIAMSEAIPSVWVSSGVMDDSMEENKL